MTHRLLTLIEYEPTAFEPADLPAVAAELLWEHFGAQVDVQYPSPRTGGRWQLTSLGWVGYLPLAAGLALHLQPGAPLANLFRMLEVAYRLSSFRLLDGLVNVQSLADFFERLALLLARRVLERGRQGFYRAYLPRVERQPVVRGRLSVADLARRSWSAGRQCHYQAHTADVPDNQILAWTLRHIARSGLLAARSRATVARAGRAVPAHPTPFTAADCLGRHYDRLNEDYRPLHALCGFFLAHAGPGHAAGDHSMTPFLVEMSVLYERFVAEWLLAHLPPALSLRVQEPVHLGRHSALTFRADLVLYDVSARQVRAVLDTKYKRAGRPEPADIYQVVTYAEARGCREAVLIYPTRPAAPFDEQVGNIRVRSLAFALDGDLDDNGRRFLTALNSG